MCLLPNNLKDFILDLQVKAFRSDEEHLEVIK